MPLQGTSGAASQDAFGGNGVPVIPIYIEEVFSTYLYTGTGATTQTITNGIDLSTKGGMVWGRPRDVSSDFSVFDSIRGSDWLRTNSIGVSNSNTGFSMLTTGFSMANMSTSSMNNNGSACVSWTFRKQPKFFDVVSWTGNATNRTISHSLGSVPACIIVKRTDANSAWQVYHRSLANTEYLVLNTTAAVATDANRWNSTTPTSTVFSLGTDATVNASGGTYVAYIFAHDAGGFGLTGTDNVISCGSFTSSGSGAASITLGYEPQWVMIKAVSTTDSWYVTDTMRGMPADPATNSPYLVPNTSAAEASWGAVNGVNATGWSTAGLASSQTYIYIAIRRGPMKVPTTGTSVFAVDKDRQSSSTSTPNYVSNFPVDLGLIKYYTAAVDWEIGSRLTGARYMNTNTTAAEASSTDWAFDYQNGFGKAGAASTDFTGWMWRRAPSFFDEVCYTGTGSATTFSHNLQAVPELMIVKRRSTAFSWTVYAASLAATEIMVLNTTAAIQAGSDAWNSTRPTSSVFSVSPGSNSTNASGSTYVAYLFATCAGVSKVGSYTGTGTTLQIDCGFTGGSRFVLIKRTDDVGDWYVWDSARGIVAGNDPYLLLNSTAAEVTNTDYVDTYSAGFEISSTAPSAINASGGSFIFLAIS